MNMFRFRVRAATITALLACTFGAIASAQDTSQRQSAADAKPVPVFKLYCGNCSRSMRFRATFASIDEVSKAAEAAKEDWTRIEIISTDLGDEFKSKYSPSQTVSYRVYAGLQRRCSVAWYLRSTHKTLQAANDAAKVLNEKSLIPARIVPHYSLKEDAVTQK